MAQHLLGDVEVGDDAVLERAHGADGGRRAAQHALGLGADGVDLAGAMVDGDHRRLGEHDAAAAEIDEGVGGTEVDRHVAGAEARHEAEEADGELLSTQVSNADCIRWLEASPTSATALDAASSPRTPGVA